MGAWPKHAPSWLVFFTPVPYSLQKNHCAFSQAGCISSTRVHASDGSTGLIVEYPGRELNSQAT